ncbi:MAG: TetR/AcrR family transcriptional regulator [Devosia sp.]
MARRADHSKEELGKLIVDTAEELIATDGIDEFSARSLSRAIGYTAGTLYHHFKDLDDIVTQVNTRTLVGLAHAFASAETSDDPKAMLHAYADAFLGYIAVKRNLWNALFEFRRKAGQPVPHWYIEAIASLIRIVASCFAQIRPDLPVDDARRSGQLVFASIHSVVSLDSSGRLSLVMDQDIRTVVHELVDMHILAFTHRG